MARSHRTLGRSMAVALAFLGAVWSSGATAAQLVMLEEDGCPWCEQWDKEVGVIYHKTPESRLAPLRRIDIHQVLPDDLKFLVKGGYTPTFILVDNNREVGRIRGYPGEDFFWGLLGKMLERLPKSSAKSSNTN